MTKLSRRKINERRGSKSAVKKAVNKETKSVKKETKAVTKIQKKKAHEQDTILDPRQNDPETTLPNANNGSQDPVLEF